MNNPLRSVLDEPRAPSAPERVWRDWVVLGVVLVCGVLELALRDDLPLPWLSAAVVLGPSPTLLWRRTHPLAVVAVAFGTAAVVDIGLILTDAPALEMFTMIYFLLLPYALFRWGSGREAAAGLGIILAVAVNGLFVNWTGPADAIGGGAILLSAFALGLAVRSQYGASQRRLAQVKSEERVQLARELHDTVAHHVSAIAIQAQAGRALAATSPDSPVEALRVIEAEASRTLAEMRAMVRVLRHGTAAEYAPQPGVADLPGLAGDSPAGALVEVTLAGDLAGLPVAVDAAVYRIVQEAVTNALRHARAATRVDVRVERNGSAVHLQVRDDGAPGTTPGHGYGLVGMVERASALGGSCHAGPLPERGWTVEATLPMEGR